MEAPQSLFSDSGCAEGEEEAEDCAEGEEEAEEEGWFQQEASQRAEESEAIEAISEGGCSPLALAPLATEPLAQVALCFMSAEYEARFKQTWSSQVRRRKLGEGSYATVELHRDTLRDMFVVAKLPKPQVEQNLEAELRINQQLGHHANVVSLLAWVADTAASPPSKLIFERCQGSLRAYWRSCEGLIDRKVTRRCCKGLVRGVHHLHSHCVLHLDICPNNCLMSWDAELGLTVKLCDFGQSATLSLRAPCDPRPSSVADLCLPPVTRATMVGTWTYRAPEISIGLPFGYPADMWSLGVIARELITGRNLFELYGAREPEMTPLQYAMHMAGPITNATWPGVESTPFYTPSRGACSHESLDTTRFSQPAPRQAKAFVLKLMSLVPLSRLTAFGAMRQLFVVRSGKRIWQKTHPVTEQCGPRRQGAGSAMVGRAPTPSTDVPGASPSRTGKGRGGALFSGAACATVSEAASTAESRKANTRQADVSCTVVSSPAASGACVCKGNCFAKGCSARWGRAVKGDLLGTCGNPTDSELHVCSFCRCFCGKVRYKSTACYQHQWTLAPIEYKAVRSFGASLQRMTPPDMAAFLDHASLDFPVASVIMAQLWCPVAVKRFAELIRHAGRQARSPQGLTNIFIDTLRFLHDVRATDQALQAAH